MFSLVIRIIKIAFSVVFIVFCVVNLSSCGIFSGMVQRDHPLLHAKGGRGACEGQCGHQSPPCHWRRHLSLACSLVVGDHNIMFPSQHSNPMCFSTAEGRVKLRLGSEQRSEDPSEYPDNLKLPFHGLKTPPNKVKSFGEVIK